MQLAKVLKSSNIYLDNLSIFHADGDYSNWMKDPQVMRYLEIRHNPPSVKELKEFIAKMRSSNDNLFLGIFLNSGRHIGNIKIGPIDWRNKRGAIGLLIGAKDCWGRGIASEVIELITAYAFTQLDLNRVDAGTYKENIGSIKSFKKAGFEEEGVLRKYWKSDDGYMDQILLGKIKE